MCQAGDTPDTNSTTSTTAEEETTTTTTETSTTTTTTTTTSELTVNKAPVNNDVVAVELEQLTESLKTSQNLG